MRFLTWLGLVGRGGMALIVSVDRGWGQAPFGLRIGHVLEIGFFIPWTPLVLTLGEVEHQLYRLIRRNVSEERIVQLAHLIEGFHDHIGMRDLSRQKVM
jgi:hypothetical protein